MTQQEDNQNEDQEVTEEYVEDSQNEDNWEMLDQEASSFQEQGNFWEDLGNPLKEKLARLQADYDNFKKRTERDREEMVFFINSKTFTKVLPRVDDLERILQNTPEDLRWNTLYTWVEALYKALIRDIEWLGIKPFISKWQKVDPERHDVMTQVPGEEWIIVDEFEKWYMLGDRVIRHAKVVVGNGN